MENRPHFRIRTPSPACGNLAGAEVWMREGGDVAGV